MVSQMDPNAPVIAGIGLLMQREDDPLRALEPLDLMIEAARAAGFDSGSDALLRKVDRILIPHGRWNYANPGRVVAAAIGATRAKTTIARVGVLQQQLIRDACERVQRGECRAVLVLGGEAGRRLQMARRRGIELSEKPAEGTPDDEIRPHVPLREAAELAAGFTMPVGLYAIIESAIAAAHGRTMDEQRDHIADLYSRFSRIAAANPHAWAPHAYGAKEIRDPVPGNPMQAFPYTTRHCSYWSVDQATALLVTTAGEAGRAGVAPEKLVYAVSSGESNHMASVSSRAILHRSPGARLAGHAALAGAGIAAGDLDLVDLYSCFPSAVQICAEELGLDQRRDLTITGGMAFAGGAYNNAMLHATGQMAAALRQGRGSTGMVGCISGVVTKQAFAVWSRNAPEQAFSSSDVTDEAARTPTLEVIADYEGDARIVGHTVMHERGAPPYAVVIADTECGRRTVAKTGDEGLCRAMEETLMVSSTAVVSNSKLVSVR